MEECISWRILIVEDDEEDYYLTWSMLRQSEGQKIQLEWAQSYEIGQEFLNENYYDAVLVDYDLGHRTGIELIRETVKRGYPAPLILFTGRGSNEVDLEAMQAGATMYITKSEANPLLLERLIRYAIERRRMESNLAYQAMVLENVHDAVIATDAEQRITAWNKAAEGLYGYTAEEALGQITSQLIRSELDDEQQTEALRKIDECSSSTMEIVQYTKDGQRVIVEASNMPVKSSDGTIVGYVCAARDITGKKQAEDELREREQKIAEILESIHDGFFALDREWRFTYVNNRAAQASDFQSHELIGKNIWELWPELIDTQLEECYRSVMEQRNPARLVYPGTVPGIWLDIGVYPSREGISVYWVDVSERKQLEEQMAYQALILENVQDAVIATDSSQRIMAWNRAAEQLYGWTKQEAIGQIAGALLQSEYSEEQRTDVMKQLETNDHLVVKIIQFAKDGRRIDVEGKIIPLHDYRGNTIGYVASNRDVSARTQVEEDLLESEKRFRTTVENMVDGLAIFTAIREESDSAGPGKIVDFCYEYINQAGCKLNRRTPEEQIGHTLLELLPSHKDSDIFDEYVRVVESGQPFIKEAMVYEDQFGNDQRMRRAFDTRAAKLGDGLVLTWSDVTQRVEAEQELRKTVEALKQSEWHLQLAHEAAGLGSWQWTFGDSHVVCSDTFFKLHGLEPDPEGRLDLEEYFSIIHPQDVERVRQLTLDAIQGNPYDEVEDNEFRIVLRDGSLRWVAAYQKAIRDEHNLLAITGVTMDITVRKNAEQAAYNSERHIRNILNNIFTFVWVLTPEGVLLETNQAPLAPAGIKFQDVFLKRFEDTYWWNYSPEAQAQLRQSIDRAAQGEASRYDATVKVAHGQTIVIDFMIAPMYDEHGQIQYLIPSGVDITDRKRAEEALQYYASRLERSNQDLEEFAFVASHDLQEPLRKVIAFGDHLKASAGGILGADENDYLDRMSKAAERMSRMLNDLLAYSRISTLPGAIVPVDLNFVAQEAVSDLEVSLQQSDGSVEIGSLPVIEARPAQMRQLLQNLIGNSLKFHRPGEAPVVQLSSTQIGDSQVQIVVSDNGIGFDPGKAEKLFQPFQRLVGRSQYDGNGIGLATCRKIVERHGGSIRAESTPGQGSIFRITLPLKQN